MLFCLLLPLSNVLSEERRTKENNFIDFSSPLNLSSCISSHRDGSHQHLKSHFARTLFAGL